MLLPWRPLLNTDKHRWTFKINRMIDVTMDILTKLKDASVSILEKVNRVLFI